MADLLGSLEIGVSRTVGATGRLRSQITRMDEYMAAQRQLEQPQNAYPYASVGGDKADNALPPSNGDPSTGLQAPQWQNLPEQHHCTGDDIGNLENGGDQFLLHLPPELLEGWPWNSDFLQTFSIFD